MPGPDVTYLVNVYQRSKGADKSGETLLRREIWYFEVAALENLNVDRGRHGNPKVVQLPGGLPSGFNWSGKMFDAVLHPQYVTLRIGLIDKSDQVPADKCCRQHHNTTTTNDPLPVGYAGYYANNPSGSASLPSWGILIPVFRPLVNLPIMQHERATFGDQQETVFRCAYYISTAPRPKVLAANIQTLMASQKRFAIQSNITDPPPLSVEPDAQIDSQGDFVNVESVGSFDDMLDNYIPNDPDALWTGALLPSGANLEPTPLDTDETDVTADDKEGA